jgi:hypothetical protein
LTQDDLVDAVLSIKLTAKGNATESNVRRKTRTLKRR